jgi:hypothetical protein
MGKIAAVPLQQKDRKIEGMVSNDVPSEKVFGKPNRMEI